MDDGKPPNTNVVRLRRNGDLSDEERQRLASTISAPGRAGRGRVPEPRGPRGGQASARPCGRPHTVNASGGPPLPSLARLRWDQAQSRRGNLRNSRGRCREITTRPLDVGGTSVHLAPEDVAPP